MRLGQTSVLYFGAKVFGSALGFFATVYFARVLGEAVLGFYFLVLALVSWGGVIGKVGFSSAITKRISEGEDTDGYFATGAVLIFGTGAVIIAGLVLFRGVIDEYVGQPVAEFVVVLLFVSLFLRLVVASLKGQHLVHVYAVLKIGKDTLRALLQVALVFVGFELAGLLIGYAAGGFVIALIGLWYLKPSRARPTLHHARSLFDFAKFSWLGNIRAKTFDWIDVIVLGFFVPAGLIGIYSIAWSIAKFLDLFGSSISTTLFPEMSKLSSEDDLQAVSGLTVDALSYAGLILIPGLIGTATVGDRLLAIYGENFPEGATILVILTVALLVYTYNKQLLNTLNAIDRPDLAFRSNGIFIVSNAVLNVVLVYEYGWIGAAAATALSAGIGLSISYYYARSLVAFSFPVVEVGRQWVAALGMGAVVYYVRQLGEAHWIAGINEAFVVLLVAVGASVYFGLLFAISKQFRTTVRDNLPFEIPVVT